MEFKESGLDFGNYKPYKIVKPPIVLDQEILSFLDEKHSDYFTRENEERRKEFGDSFNSPLNARMVVGEYFRELSLTPELLQNKTVLYLGSANSMFDEYCEKKYGAKFISIDINEQNLGKLHPQGIVADARSLPFAENSFDLVISKASMPHVFVPSVDDNGEPIKIEGGIEVESKDGVMKVFTESYRILKPGGEIRLTTFSEKEMEGYVTKSDEEQKYFEQHLSRILLIKKVLETFKAESGAQCVFNDEENGGLIIIKKPKGVTT